MLYRRFGRTELSMPVFSTGGMRYQHKWQDCPLSEIPEENQKNLEATIHRSIEAGINHIETARGYGSSERQLGLVLPQYPREDLIVQTKIGPEKDADVFKSNFYDSLERLRLDYVDLMAIHGINNDETMELAVRPGGCLEKARELREEGLVRHIGFSSHATPEFLPKAVGYEDEDGGFDYVNLHFYFIYQKHWPSIEIATKRDMGVFLISPTDKGGMLYNPPEKLVELCRPLHPIVFNDLWCLMHSEVHTLSLGAARPSDYDHHLEAVEKWWDKRHDLVPGIAARILQEIDTTFGEENYFAHFDEGIPEWKNIPGGVNVQIILWLHMLAKSLGMTEYGKMRYNLLGNADHWFPGQNVKKLDLEKAEVVLNDARHSEHIFRRLKEADEMLWKEEEVKRLSESEPKEEPAESET